MALREKRNFIAIWADKEIQRQLSSLGCKQNLLINLLFLFWFSRR